MIAGQALLENISNASAHHVSVISGKPEVHPIISQSGKIRGVIEKFVSFYDREKYGFKVNFVMIILK